MASLDGVEEREGVKESRVKLVENCNVIHIMFSSEHLKSLKTLAMNYFLKRDTNLTQKRLIKWLKEEKKSFDSFWMFYFILQQLQLTMRILINLIRPISTNLLYLLWQSMFCFWLIRTLSISNESISWFKLHNTNLKVILMSHYLKLIWYRTRYTVGFKKKNKKFNHSWWEWIFSIYVKFWTMFA